MYEKTFSCSVFFLLSGMNIYTREPLRSLPPSFVTKPPFGPWCLVVINYRYCNKDCRLIESLIKPKYIESLKVETGGTGAAMEGYRAANGIVVIEIEKRNWKSEFPKLKPYLKGL